LYYLDQPTFLFFMPNTLMTAEEAKAIAATTCKKTTEFYIQRLGDEILKASRIGLHSITYHVTDIDERVKEEVDTILTACGYVFKFKRTAAPKIASYSIDWS
jgi:hypothetical protein